jgi:hypothetical protein
MNRDLKPAEWTLLDRIERSNTADLPLQGVRREYTRDLLQLLLYRLIERGDKNWRLTDEGRSLLDNATGRRRPRYDSGTPAPRAQT